MQKATRFVTRAMAAVPAMLASAAVWAADEQARPNVTTTSYEIYASVIVVLVVGFLWVLWLQKKEKQREERRRERSATQS